VLGVAETAKAVDVVVLHPATKKKAAVLAIAKICMVFIICILSLGRWPRLLPNDEAERLQPKMQDGT
jgi:hypothetical protein